MKGTQGSAGIRHHEGEIKDLQIVMALWFWLLYIGAAIRIRILVLFTKKLFNVGRVQTENSVL